jgi:hypothetical protein
MYNSNLEKSLLSTTISANYLSTYDIVQIGKILGIKLPYKKRSLILKELFIYVKKNNIQKMLLIELLKLIEKKEQKYLQLNKNYKNSSSIILEWLKKLNSIKRLIHHYE